MAIEWTQEPATGVDLIDEQHKELFRRIDALLQACMRGEGAQAVGQTLDYLSTAELRNEFAAAGSGRA